MKRCPLRSACVVESWHVLQIRVSPMVQKAFHHLRKALDTSNVECRVTPGIHRPDISSTFDQVNCCLNVASIDSHLQHSTPAREIQRVTGVNVHPRGNQCSDRWDIIMSGGDDKKLPCSCLNITLGHGNREKWE